MSDRFRLLTGGARTALPRHQTSRALVDWSYELLAEGEWTLCCRLGVLAGDWSLEAAEAEPRSQSRASHQALNSSVRGMKTRLTSVSGSITGSTGNP